ncbi:hypothetical protein EXN61_13260 [Agrobacterium tumefaciens]|uniref:Uncharacterized protein n=1 Tax=Agrobacterium tumefaciens TaxID=358 RepID=A0A546XZI1_AGRTU|nr:hypothetical protein EXN61_13260 [Agrobacterium tumefaciens]
MAVARELRNGSPVMNKIFPSCTQPLRMNDQNLRRQAKHFRIRRNGVELNKFSRILPFHLIN